MAPGSLVQQQSDKPNMADGGGEGA